MVYKNAKEFLDKERPKISKGMAYYTISQVASGIGIDWQILKGLVASGNLESMLDFKLVVDSFNLGKYFPAEAIPKLYKHKMRLIQNQIRFK